jgi:chromosome segregation ATPase
LQEELKKLRPTVSRLKIEKQELEKDIPLLTEKKIKAQEEVDSIIAKANEDAEKIREKASALYTKLEGQKKETEEKLDKANRDILESKSLMDKANALITSNENRDKNLEIAERDIKALKIKLENISRTIKEMLEV